MAGLKRSSLPEQVFHELVSAVLDGRYAAGERLPPQRALAADLGVTMSSLREGIKRLEQLRLLDVRHGDAMRVRDWRMDGGLDVLAYAAVSDPHLLGALFEARRLLLREAAALAADRRTTAQAQALHDLARAVATAPDRRSALVADLAFMGSLIDAAGNLVFTLILNSIRELYLQHLDAFEPMLDRAADLVPAYAETARAVEAQDAERAAAAVERLARAQEDSMREAAA